MKDQDLCQQELNQLFQKHKKFSKNLKSQLSRANQKTYLLVEMFLKILAKNLTSLHLDKNHNRAKEIDFQTSLQPSFNKQFDLIINYLKEKTIEGYQNYIVCSSAQQKERFQNIFSEIEEQIEYKTTLSPFMKDL